MFPTDGLFFRREMMWNLAWLKVHRESQMNTKHAFNTQWINIKMNEIVKTKNIKNHPKDINSKWEESVCTFEINLQI